MPVPENTEEKLTVDVEEPSTKPNEQMVTETDPAINETSEVVNEAKDAKPAKKKKFKLRLRPTVTTQPNRATDFSCDTDGNLKDQENCAEKLDSLNLDKEKDEPAKEFNERVIEKTTIDLIKPPKPLPTLAYDEITRLSRTMHYVDFRKCFNAKKFITSQIKPQYKTLLPTNGSYVWFRAQNSAVNDESQDWFGNVKCSFDLLSFLNENKDVKLFYVDCAYFGYSSASRILLTTKSHFKNAKKIDLGSLSYGDPLLFDGEKLFYLRKDVSQNKKWSGNHQTEFVIDASTIDIGKLFRICDVNAVNHSKANRKSKNKKYVFHQCLIYNSNSKSCPSAWTVEETAKCLKDFMGIDNSSSVPKI